MVIFILKVIGIVVPVALVVCGCLEWYFSRKERAARLTQAIAYTEWVVGLRDLGELGVSSSGKSHLHVCGNRLRVGSKLRGGRTLLYCPFCCVEVFLERADEPQSSPVVVPFDPFRRIQKARRLENPNPPPTAA